MRSLKYYLLPQFGFPENRHFDKGLGEITCLRDDSRKQVREQESKTGWRGTSIKGVLMSRPQLWATGA